MIGMIVAVSPEGVIGLHGKIPWRHPGDLKRFKRLTIGKTVIMGRNTWESIGKPLVERRNIVITSRAIEGVETFADLPSALATIRGDAWLIGGARIYAEGMRFADQLDVTYVPERIDHPDAVKLPSIDPSLWEAGPLVEHEDEPGLTRRVFTRR
jgi:dihydrofolate reductase